MAKRSVLVRGCKATTVRELSRAHGLQFLGVSVDCGGEIPLHTHSSPATMIVTHGSAKKLTGNGPGKRVRAGDVVVKGSNEPHGFTGIGKKGFRFISISEGIVRPSKSLDMKFVS